MRNPQHGRSAGWMLLISCVLSVSVAHLQYIVLSGVLCTNTLLCVLLPCYFATAVVAAAAAADPPILIPCCCIGVTAMQGCQSLGGMGLCWLPVAAAMAHLASHTRGVGLVAPRLLRASWSVHRCTVCPGASGVFVRLCLCNKSFRPHHRGDGAAYLCLGRLCPRSVTAHDIQALLSQ